MSKNSPKMAPITTPGPPIILSVTSANVLILNGIVFSISSVSLSLAQSLMKMNLRQRRATFAPNLLAT